MIRLILVVLAVLLAPDLSSAKEPAKASKEKLVSGMSIVGNDESPKSLVIVPWKSSDLGASLDVSDSLDAGRRPVDREVFVRALDYYEVRSGKEK